MTAVFSQNHFDVFSIEGLDERMEGIRGEIQPVFRSIGEELIPFLQESLGHDMHVHIAQHARRKVNPPKDTWMAFSPNKRGYKKLPHFQVGLWDDHVFVWLAYIYELPNKAEIASYFKEEISTVARHLPEEGAISADHMKKDAIAVADLTNEQLAATLDRFENVKKAEFLIGKQYKANDPLLADKEAFLKDVKSVYSDLIPLFKQSLAIQEQ